jgi:hypothetical protein
MLYYLKGDVFLDSPWGTARMQLCRKSYDDRNEAA